MRWLLLALALGQHKPWSTGIQGTGAVVPPSLAWDTAVCATPTTCPTASQASGSTGTVLTTGSFATTAGTLLAVGIGFNCSTGAATLPASPVSYGGLTFSQAATANDGANGVLAAVWTAPAPSGAASGTLTVTRNANTCAGAIYVFGIAGSGTQSSLSTCTLSNDASGTVQCTTSQAPLSSSWFLGVGLDGQDTTTLNAAASNTFDKTFSSVNEYIFFGRYTGALGSNVTFGSGSPSTTFRCAAAVEVKL